MTTTDRHILLRVARAYLFLVVALVVFFILLHYLEYIDDFLDRKAPLSQLYTRYYPSYIPEIVRLISPLALFLAAVHITGSLSQSLQIIALQTGGVSLTRLFVPYLTIGLVVSIGMVFFNGYLVPVTNRTVLEWDSLYLKDAPRRIDINEVYRQDSPVGILTVGYYDSRSEEAHRVVLQKYDSTGSMVQRIDAQKMQWADSLWHIPFATLRAFSDGEEKLHTIATFDTLLQVLPRDLARTERDIEAMTLPVAADYIESLHRSGAAQTGAAEVGYYTKFTYPFANLVVVLIAVPLAFRRRRGGQAVRIGLGLLLAFCYLAAQKLVEPFGYSEEVAPLIAATAPHLLFMGLAAIMISRSRA